MIPASRFIVQSRYEDEWLAARAVGVTATAVAEAATPSGFRNVVASWSAPPFMGNAYTEFGKWAERHIMSYAHQEHGIPPSDWLFASADNPLYLGTPDGIDPTHTRIAEAKTGGTLPRSVPRQHRDQCLWNLAVTDTERCLYLFQPRRIANDGSFYLGLWEPLTFWVDRDEKRISELKNVAESLLAARQTERMFDRM